MDVFYIPMLKRKKKKKKKKKKEGDLPSGCNL
jgi:hypothetical protein